MRSNIGTAPGGPHTPFNSTPLRRLLATAPGVTAGPALADELIAFCNAHLSRQKVPRSIDFTDELIGARFVVENPNASSSCGCGTSFSI